MNLPSSFHFQENRNYEFTQYGLPSHKGATKATKTKQELVYFKSFKWP